MRFEELDSEGVYWEERGNDRQPARPNEFGRSGGFSSRKITPRNISRSRSSSFPRKSIRLREVRLIKRLVKKGQYETEEKIRVTALRILSRI